MLVLKPSFLWVLTSVSSLHRYVCLAGQECYNDEKQSYLSITTKKNPLQTSKLDNKPATLHIAISLWKITFCNTLIPCYLSASESRYITYRPSLIAVSFEKWLCMIWLHVCLNFSQGHAVTKVHGT